MVAGVTGPLSVLVWAWTDNRLTCNIDIDTPAASQKAALLKHPPMDSAFASAANSVRHTLDHLASITHDATNTPNFLDSIEVDVAQSLADIPEKTSTLLEHLSQSSLLKTLIILGGIVACAGLLLALVARKKTVTKKWHLFNYKAGPLLAIENTCLTCGEVFKHVKNPTSSTPSYRLWIIEITLNTASHRQSMEAIKSMALPVIRREHNFIIIGPYKQKQAASHVIDDLNAKHGVRGWLMEGN